MRTTSSARRRFVGRSVVKAILYSKFGGPEVLGYRGDRPSRALRRQALVGRGPAGPNPIDVKHPAGIFEGRLPRRVPPHPRSSKWRGTVVGLERTQRGSLWGQGHRLPPHGQKGRRGRFRPSTLGDTRPGTVGHRVVDAAALPVGGLTAWQALFEHGDLRASQRVLINGAGGGVGGFAVQFAKWAGAFVIATASERSKKAVRSQGADQVVDYTVGKLTEQVDEPVDVVFSLVTTDEAAMAGLVGLVRPGGVIVTAATSARPIRRAMWFGRHAGAQRCRAARRDRLLGRLGSCAHRRDGPLPAERHRQGP